MHETRYLTAADVIALANGYMSRLGYAEPVLRADGYGLLESAVARAQAVAYYAGGDLIDQAAALTNGVALNHPFIDGNKRTAWIACVTFLDINGRPLRDEALLPLAEQIIAPHELTDRQQADAVLSRWLRTYMEPAAVLD